MDRLARTRSQHFVHSPRRVGSPLKLRHNSTVNRHTTKRRRLGSNVNGHGSLRNGNIVDLTHTSGSESEDSAPETSRQRAVIPLSSEVGAQTVNRHGRKGGHLANGVVGGKKDIKGKGKVALPPPPPESVIFSSEDGSSPRKRKRTHSGSDEGDSSSWIELDEDEAEPEFIAEGDQHLIDDAPAYALHRLRKAELVRLWKVAGMWPGEEGDEGLMTTQDEEEDGKGLSKRDLVDGLIAGRKPPSPRIDSPSRTSPRHRNSLEAAFEMRRTKSTSSSLESSASSDEVKDIESTPKAVPRARQKARVRVETVGENRSGPRRGAPAHGVRERLLKSRSKSMGGPGERDERRARFGDHVKSPGRPLLTHRTRRASTQSSSAYTTTDTSPPNTPVNSRQTSRRPRRSGITPAKRLGIKLSRPSSIHYDEDDEEMETVHSGSGSEDADPTPLINRLRPRTKSFTASEHVSEADADGEDEPTEDEEEASLFSPGPSSRLRSRSRNDSDVPMSLDDVEQRPSATRGAKERAKEAIKHAESSGDDMDVDEKLVNGHVSPRRPSPPKHRRHTRRNSRLLSNFELAETEVPESNTSTVLTPAPPSGTDVPTIDEETETEATRTTRSGRAFGVWQSRRKRLRQEALDDPDMDVDEEDNDDAADSDEGEDDSFEADVDLSDATVASLTRLLRDELVVMCESRGIEVGGTKPQLAKALLEWRDEQQHSDAKSSTSSQATARPSSSSSKSTRRTHKSKSSGRIIHAVGSHVHKSGQTTPVLLRDHVHAHDPATPPHSDDSKKTAGEAELNLDLQELGLEDSVIRPDLLVKLERIGSGGFKDVYVGKYRGRKVAISEFREHLSEMDIRELKLLAEFSHPNIVKFRGICIPEDNSQIPCMLVSELCENGDLFDYIRNVDCPPLKRVLGLMLDIAKGLEYLHNHSPPIIHRDCKSSNILINRAGQAKVGDFGLARVKNSTRSMIRSLVGTVNWQAPELWSPKPQYDYKVDVFSAALVFWEMLSGWTGDKKYPWEGHNEHYIYDAVGQKLRRPSTAGLRKHWGTEPVNLMERMWHQDPKERPTMTDVVTDLEVLYAAA